MKVSEYRQAMKYLTSSATDKVKSPTSSVANSKTVTKPSVTNGQVSKPARARFIVNPVTGEYENVNAPTKEEINTAKRDEFMKFYGYGDRIAQKQNKLLDYIDKVKANDTKTLRMINEYQPLKKPKQVVKKIFSEQQLDLTPIVRDIYALEEAQTPREKYEQSIANPDTFAGIAGLLPIKRR
tara:strand:+ start:280 stop:825 length:546 start_codon:yes stop_codon:yes gene_type:complete